MRPTFIEVEMKGRETYVPRIPFVMNIIRRDVLESVPRHKKSVFRREVAHLAGQGTS